MGTSPDPEARESKLCSQDDRLEKEMATHCSILAWETLWTEEPAGLQPMGLKRVSCNLVTKKQDTRVGGGGEGMETVSEY